MKLCNKAKFNTFLRILIISVIHLLILCLKPACPVISSKSCTVLVFRIKKEIILALLVNAFFTTSLKMINYEISCTTHLCVFCLVFADEKAPPARAADIWAGKSKWSYEIEEIFNFLSDKERKNYEVSCVCAYVCLVYFIITIVYLHALPSLVFQVMWTGLGSSQ